MEEDPPQDSCIRDCIGVTQGVYENIKGIGMRSLENRMETKIGNQTETGVTHGVGGFHDTCRRYCKAVL